MAGPCYLLTVLTGFFFLTFCFWGFLVGKNGSLLDNFFHGRGPGGSLSPCLCLINLFPSIPLHFFFFFFPSCLLSFPPDLVLSGTGRVFFGVNLGLVFPSDFFNFHPSLFLSQIRFGITPSLTNFVDCFSL